MAMVNKLSQDDEVIRVRNKDHAGRRAELWTKEANDRMSELSRLLATLSTLTISLSLPIVFGNEVNLTSTMKSLFITSWIMGFVSIIFGVINLVADSRYFSKIAKIDNDSEGIWSQRNKTIDEMADDDEENRVDYSRSSSFTPLKLQGLFAGISLFTLIILGIVALSSKYPHQNKYYSHPRIHSQHKWQQGLFYGPRH